METFVIEMKINQQTGCVFALLKKIESRCEPYIVAFGYDKETATWNHVHYFDGLRDALDYYEAFAND